MKRYLGIPAVILLAILTSAAVPADTQPDAPKSGGAVGPRGPQHYEPQDNPARRICFVCDCSKTAEPTLDVLRDELRKAIEGLKPIQSFNIMFGEAEKPAVWNQRELSAATAENKKRAMAFVDGVRLTEKTDPVSALKSAFEQKPDLIYYLSDHDIADGPAVVDAISKANKDHKVKVNTIAFEAGTPIDEASHEVLEKIAKESGGAYKRIRPEEIAK